MVENVVVSVKGTKHIGDASPFDRDWDGSTCGVGAFFVWRVGQCPEFPLSKAITG